MLGVSYDDPEVTAPEKLRYDAALTVREGVEGEGDVGVQTIGPGEYAVTRHIGPYQRLSETYARLCGEWLPASGRIAEFHTGSHGRGSVLRCRSQKSIQRCQSYSVTSCLPARMW